MSPCIHLGPDIPWGSSVSFVLRIHSQYFCLQQIFLPFVSKLCTCKNWPSVHDVPSYLEGPSVGHMALSLGHNPRLGSSPISAPGRDKKPPVLLSLRSLSFLLFPLVCLFGLQTELNQQLHTPDAQSVGRGTFCCGATTRGSRYTEIEHHNGPRLIPAFSEPCPPSSVPSYTSLMPPPLPFFLSGCSGRSLGMFTLLCCCQQSWLEQQGSTGKSRIQLKGGINLECVIRCHLVHDIINMITVSINKTC